MSLNIVTVLVCCVLLTAAVTVQGGVTGRIVGGAEAAETQFPYIVSVRLMNEHVCGGSVISDKFILTAAHCVVNEDFTLASAADYSIRAGTKDRRYNGIEEGVAKITIHSSYKGSMQYDIAVLELENPLPFNLYIQPIELATEEVPAGSDVIVSGWGRTVGNEIIESNLLKFNTLKAMDTFKCSPISSGFTDAILCLGHEVGNGACNGDSGGPAVYDGKLVGVAGFVVRSCGSNMPDGYAKVSTYIEWIRSIINQ